VTIKTFVSDDEEPDPERDGNRGKPPQLAPAPFIHCEFDARSDQER
jgi:hypothetical protein